MKIKLYLYINLKALWAQRRILDSSLPGLHLRGGKKDICFPENGLSSENGLPPGAKLNWPETMDFYSAHATKWWMSVLFWLLHMSLSNNSNITKQFWACMVTQNYVVTITPHVVHESTKLMSIVTKFVPDAIW